MSSGDDILIFDQDRFPTLRLLDSNDFAQKQRIPVEAVYAYLEAKHTLLLEGDGPQSLHKACEQVDAVKKLSRDQVPLTQVNPGLRLELLPGLGLKRQEFWPSYWNPIYGAVISRRIKLTSMTEESFARQCQQAGGFSVSEFATDNPPDLLILGDKFFCCPSVNRVVRSPFFVPGVTTLTSAFAPQRAFAVGLSMLCWALDSIQLGTISWAKIIDDEVKWPTIDQKEE